MARVRPASPAFDPANDAMRHRLRQADARTPADLARRQARDERADPTAPRNRPVVSGSRTDGSALASLLAALAELGYVDDQTVH